LRFFNNLSRLHNRKLFGFDSFHKNLLLFVVITGVLFASMHPIKSSLFSGSGWRNTQTYAAFPCFKEADNWKEFARCYFAPKLGFDDKHYVGLEQPVLPLLDYVFDSKITEFKFKSKTQLLALILILIPVLFFFRFTVLSFALTALYYIALADNPTLNFFALSYQPDLLSMALLFTGAALGALDKKGRSYIPDLLVGIGILVKPQHAAVGFLLMICFRYLNMRLTEVSYSKLFKMACVIVLPTLFYIISGKIAIKMGAGVVYPSLTTLLGGFKSYPKEFILENFKQMFARNGQEYLYLTYFFILLAIAFALRLKGRIGAVILVVVTAVFAYVFTYCVFLTGFIANLYYGSVLFITANMSVLYFFSMFCDYEEETPFKIFNRWYVILPVCALVITAFLALDRKPAHFEYVLRDRHHNCEPAEVRGFSDKIPVEQRLLNSGYLEPTVRTALGGGNSLWHTGLGTFREKNKNEIMSGKDFYYFSCSYFTDMMNSNEKSVRFLNEYSDLVFKNGEWTVWKLK